MDGMFTPGFPPRSPSQGRSLFQRTLKAPIGCVGTGVHSGQRVALTLFPAPADHGIVFCRNDLTDDVRVPARFDVVVDTRLCTVLSHPDDASIRIGTVEHLMAALAGAGIDNVQIEVDGPELPILDGSSAPFLFLIDCAGTIEQTAPRRTIQVLRTVQVNDGDAFAELRPQPYPSRGELDMTLSIDFAAPDQSPNLVTLRTTFVYVTERPEFSPRPMATLR